MNSDMRIEKRFLSFLLTLVMAITLVPAFTVEAIAVGPELPSWASYGEGTSTSPYAISSYTSLAAFAESVNSGTSYGGVYIKLVDGFPTSGELTTPVGISEDNYFAGNFDGNGQTVRLNITSSNAYAGLFGYWKSIMSQGDLSFDSLFYYLFNFYYNYDKIMLKEVYVWQLLNRFRTARA